MHTAILSRKLTSVATLGIFAAAALMLSMFPVKTHAATPALAVIDITNESSAAKADNDFTHGFKYTFHIAIPAGENSLKMKFSNWTSGSNSIPAASNVRMYSSDSSNASTSATAIIIPTANTFGSSMIIKQASPSIVESGHAHVVVEVRIPAGTPAGSYSATYSIETLEQFPSNGNAGNGDEDTTTGSNNTNSGSSGNGDDDGFNGSHGVITDNIAPTATVSYSLTTITNQDVVATITPSETVTVTNNGGSLTHTFTENGSFTFQFADAAGNTGTAVATVSNIDKVLPVITILGDNPQIIEVGQSYVELGVNATDNVQASSLVTTGLPIDTSSVGTAQVTYTATDTAGNVQTAIRQINIVVIDRIAPTATVDYSSTGVTFNDVIATITPSEPVTVTNNGGDLSYTFTENGSFTFQFTDAGGNAGSVVATVSNIDKESPVLTIIGDNPLMIELGSPYVEFGATVTDNFPGVSVVSINSSGINTSVAGTYQASYSVNDVAGNYVSSNRQVIVSGPTHMIIATAGADGTITPAGSVSVEEGTSKSFVVDRNPGYQILDVKINGVSVNNNGSLISVYGNGSYQYTFSNVVADNTISATFIANVNDVYFTSFKDTIDLYKLWILDQVPNLPQQPQTPESLAAFQSAIDAAVAVYNNPMTTRVQVNAAHVVLWAAGDAFDPAPVI